MSVVTMKELLEAGVHFGHQSKRWNPKMKRYIYAARNDIHVIDLNQSIPLIEEAYEFLKKLVKENQTVLFVGTKKQAQEAIEEEAKRCGMFFVNQRWMGGTLTNFKTLKKNITRLNEIEKMKEDGTFDLLPKKEVILIEREHRKLVRGLGGIRQMTALPGAVFIVDTNADPDEVDYPIPGNDDAIRAIKLLTGIVAEAILAGRESVKRLDENGEEIAVPAEGEEIPEEARVLSEEERLEAIANIKLKEETEKEEK